MINENGGEIHAKKCDLSNETEILSLFQWVKEKFGHLNVLICNAGIMKANLVTSEFLFLYNRIEGRALMTFFFY